MNELSFKKIDPNDFSEKHFKQYVAIEQNCGLAPYSMSFIEECLFSGDYENFACYDNEDLVGFITIADEMRYKNSIYIANLNVKEDYRNKGVATRLIYEMCKYYKNEGFNKNISLDVSLNNEKAMSLYKKIGFRVYPLPSVNGEDNVVMAAHMKDLDKTIKKVLKSSRKR